MAENGENQGMEGIIEGEGAGPQQNIRGNAEARPTLSAEDALACKYFLCT